MQHLPRLPPDRAVMVKSIEGETARGGEGSEALASANLSALW